MQWDRGRQLLRGVAPEVAAPLEIEVVNVATPQSSGALVLFLVAYYGLFAAVIGGMAAALDATAGERERQSPEPLLMTPATPLELAAGKWLAVVVQDALVVVLTLAGFYLTLRFAPLPSVGVPFLLSAVQTNLRSRNGRFVGQGLGSRQGRGRRGTGCRQGRGRHGQ